MTIAVVCRGTPRWGRHRRAKASNYVGLRHSVLDMLAIGTDAGVDDIALVLTMKLFVDIAEVAANTNAVLEPAVQGQYISSELLLPSLAGFGPRRPTPRIWQELYVSFAATACSCPSRSGHRAQNRSSGIEVTSWS